MVSNWWMLVDVNSKTLVFPHIIPHFATQHHLFLGGVTNSSPHQAMASHALLWPPNSAIHLEMPYRLVKPLLQHGPVLLN